MEDMIFLLISIHKSVDPQHPNPTDRVSKLRNQQEVYKKKKTRSNIQLANCGKSVKLSLMY